MFTIKLYTDAPSNHGTAFIASADKVTIYRYSTTGSAQISAHRKNGDDECFWVGAPDHGLPNGTRIFDHAIIENANGRTTEIVHQIPSFEPAVPSSIAAPVPARQAA